MGGEVARPSGRPPRGRRLTRSYGAAERHIEQHRDAALGEGEMVGAVEEAALGMVLRR